MILDGLPPDAPQEVVAAVMAAIAAHESSRSAQASATSSPSAWGKANLREATTSEPIRARSDLLEMGF